jgi:hypothetical protein
LLLLACVPCLDRLDCCCISWWPGHSLAAGPVATVATSGTGRLPCRCPAGW